MVGMKIPVDAVKHKCIKEGIDPSFLDKYGPDDMVRMEASSARCSSSKMR